MKTTAYNPSKIEIEFSNALQSLAPELEEKLGYKIASISPFNNKDNPHLVVALSDADGDPHELVISLIQRPDK